MNNKSNSSNNTRWQILKEYFKDDIKIAFKTVDQVFIITKEDVFYKIDLYENEFSSFVSTKKDSIIKKMIFKQLCNIKIIKLTSGFKHFIARTIDHKVYIWGDNHWGQRGNGKKYEDLKVPEVNEFLLGFNIIAVECGSSHSLALTQNGQIYAWGLNSYGQIGCYNNKLIPTRVEGLDGEKITMISCGFCHSMALTEGGKVFGWGDNRCGQSGAVGIDFFATPKRIKLNNISIVKISCGRLHSLILSSDGDIYITVKISCDKNANNLEDNQNSFAKLEHENKFKDIASHWNEDITMGLSTDNIYYFWDKRSENETLIPTETKFKSFNRLFTHHCEYYFESSKDFIKFHDLIFRDGYYKNHFEEKDELGSGSYGTVFKAVHNIDEYAVKKIRFDKYKRDEILREQQSFFVVHRLKRQLIVHHFFAWLENEINDSIVLYIRMELCDRTLEDAMGEIDKDPKMKSNGVLTPIGYFIASRIYIEILEGVKYLHENDIIHRDLNPCNIMLKIDRFNERIARICDFNLIAIHKSARQSHSNDKGHARYEAPEVYNGTKYDTKADIYSLGIILEELFELDMNGYRFRMINFLILF
jgi:tRNA A-37 threonylcarbamoyl transferase component Bud32